jgi:hypothetical protein
MVNAVTQTCKECRISRGSDPLLKGSQCREFGFHQDVMATETLWQLPKPLQQPGPRRRMYGPDLLIAMLPIEHRRARDSAQPALCECNQT